VPPITFDLIITRKVPSAIAPGVNDILNLVHVVVSETGVSVAGEKLASSLMLALIGASALSQTDTVNVLPVLIKLGVVCKTPAALLAPVKL
jgi:hypothetical protein